MRRALRTYLTSLLSLMKLWVSSETTLCSNTVTLVVRHGKALLILVLDTGYNLWLFPGSILVFHHDSLPHYGKSLSSPPWSSSPSRFPPLKCLPLPSIYGHALFNDSTKICSVAVTGVSFSMVSFMTPSLWFSSWPSVETLMTHSHNHLHDCDSIHGPHCSFLHGQGHRPFHDSVYCPGCTTVDPGQNHGYNKCFSEAEEYPSKRERCEYFKTMILSHFTIHLVGWLKSQTLTFFFRYSFYWNWTWN